MDFTTSIANVLTIQEFSCYLKASKHEEWIDATKKELDWNNNDTWDLINLPLEKKVSGSKWVYKVKYYPNGKVEQLKARLFAIGYNQVEGIDFHSTFSPITNHGTIHIVIVIVVAYNWPLHQIGVTNTFLDGYLDEDNYMLSPECYSKAKPNQVCKLKRSL